MTDSTQTATVEPESIAPSEETKNTELSPVPYERFQEVNNIAKAYKAELAALQAAEDKRQEASTEAEKKSLENQNKFKELWEKSETEKQASTASTAALTAKVDSMAKALEAQWTAQKTLIPEMFLPLVESMPIEQRIEWLSVNSEKLSVKDSKNGTPRRTGNRGITPPEQLKPRARVSSI